jgi:hypothetical protein
MAKKPGKSGIRRNPTKGDGTGERKTPRKRVPKHQQIEQSRKLRAVEVDEFERRKRAQMATVELDHMDVAMFELIHKHPGITQEVIGDTVGLGRQSVNERMNAPKFKRAMEIGPVGARDL